MTASSTSSLRRALRPPPAALVLASLEADRRMIARTARELGYRVIETADPFDALALLRDRPGIVQLLLVEVGLPRMDGGEVAERARDLVPGLRTVFLSDDPDGPDAEILRAYPETLVLETPPDPRALSAVLRAALGRARPPAPRFPTRGTRAPRPSDRHLSP